jgi:hypothetical protein
LIKGGTISLEAVEIGTVGAAEMEEAVGVIVRGMRDNPNVVAAFGQDPGGRQRSCCASSVRWLRRRYPVVTATCWPHAGPRVLSWGCAA